LPISFDVGPVLRSFSVEECSMFPPPPVFAGATAGKPMGNVWVRPWRAMLTRGNEALRRQRMTISRHF